MAMNVALCELGGGAFPTAEELAACEASVLQQRCGLGYRTKSILKLAAQVCSKGCAYRVPVLARHVIHHISDSNSNIANFILSLVHLQCNMFQVLSAADTQSPFLFLHTTSCAPMLQFP